ncbi:CPBP family intramembrane metalloprotease [Halorussus gelatinilyticus]|uniref:CPBP family intramembrane metalloprotease n=1 Tax=Halorussus gelatinilyticus TaxID=2937524 RepID=A0A8U0INB0_9EURY|nr:CPBP family intramembrane glutamic endopeptidase [Halorussus gelatinilyticus]UPW02056.1 CPBP family intramembrane metalloprotease [Halorussus gelatinilyticus]
MATVSLVWLAAVVGYLPAQLVYVIVSSSVVSAYPRLRRYNYWTYAAFSLLYGGAFYVVAPVSVPFAFRSAYLALVPVGFAMYYADTYAVSRAVGTSLQRDVSHPFSMLPILLVPIPEEILFRAGLAPLIDAFGPVAFGVASALLFGLIHFTFGARDVVVKVGNGIVFASVFVVTGSVTATILVHLGYNLASFHVFSDYSEDLAALP